MKYISTYRLLSVRCVWAVSTEHCFIFISNAKQFAGIGLFSNHLIFHQLFCSPLPVLFTVSRARVTSVALCFPPCNYDYVIALTVSLPFYQIDVTAIRVNAGRASLLNVCMRMLTLFTIVYLLPWLLRSSFTVISPFALSQTAQHLIQSAVVFSCNVCNYFHMICTLCRQQKHSISFWTRIYTLKPFTDPKIAYCHSK